MPEPCTTIEFRCSRDLVIVQGCFRHTRCSKMSSSDFPLTNFMCFECSRIPQKDDFRKRVIRESASVEKRGTRYAIRGRRIDYLGHHELALHGRVVARKLKFERALLWQTKTQVVQLKRAHRSLKLNATENFICEEVFAFYNNILSTHRTNAFGGKPALWDFLRDVAANLNWSKQGYRFSTNTKSFAQAMKIYRDRRMCDLFSLNYAAPSYNTIKCENKKVTRFVAGEHAILFRNVAKIYKDALEAHGILGPIPIIVAEDETKLMSRVACESQFDTLVGFKGIKEGHCCMSAFKPVVGGKHSGYEKIVDAFQNFKVGSFVRVIMVNLLHKKLPRLVLVVCCTCNCFDSQWVKKQWTVIDKLWQKICEDIVGL